MTNQSIPPIDIQVQWVGPGEPMLPHAHSTLAAGNDVRAAISEPLLLEPGQRALVPTGLAIALPAGFEAQVRPRSGLAFKHGITVLNSPGTIDADYRGEIKIILIHHGTEPYTIQPGERIAQLVVAPVQTTNWTLTDTLPSTARQEGGFGSTGTK
jgi:dUTP pyrophosphatase